MLGWGAMGAPLGLRKGSQMAAELAASCMVKSQLANSCTCFRIWGQCPLQHAEG